jgi:hypothetical protein
MNTKYPNVIAAVVILIAVVVIMMTQERRDDCDVHLENFRKTVQSDLYSQNLKTTQLPPRLKGAISNCKQSNNSGACLDTHQAMQKVVEAIHRLPKSCYLALQAEAPLKGAMIEVMKLYTEIAWGESPPVRTNQIGEGTWLEYSDYAFFCVLKNAFIEVFGRDQYFEIELKLVQDLPGDAPIIENGKCSNCEFRKSALQVLGFAETKKRSLLELNCSRF